MKISSAILSLRPNAKFSVEDNNYDKIVWLDKEQTKPTKKEVNDEVARLTKQYQDTEYQRIRAEEYPSIESQLDTIFHGGLDAWKEQIQAIKDKYPKPE